MTESITALISIPETETHWGLTKPVFVGPDLLLLDTFCRVKLSDGRYGYAIQEEDGNGIGIYAEYGGFDAGGNLIRKRVAPKLTVGTLAPVQKGGATLFGVGIRLIAWYRIQS